MANYGRAIPLLDRALAQRPHDRRALRALAWACARSNRVERARATGQRLIERDASIDNRLLYANVLRETEATEEAAELYEEILLQEPDQAC